MKKLLITVVVTLIYATMAMAQEKNVKIDSTAKDSVQYQLVVLDPGYESFLLTQPPANYYPESYYRSWNIRYVAEWNLRYDNSMDYRNLYETRIDYDPQKHYGLELEYRLYNYFLFFEKTNHVKLIQRR